jgi:hypothetical protein
MVEQIVRCQVVEGKRRRGGLLEGGGERLVKKKAI